MAKCDTRFEPVHYDAHLNQGISAVLPPLNAALGGLGYTGDSPSLTIRTQGKLITFHSQEIAINALRDEQKAEKILQWLKKRSRYLEKAQ